jgi:hypothetical protein
LWQTTGQTEKKNVAPMANPIIRRIKQWYAGTDIEPENDPRSSIQILHLGRRKRHWTASITRFLVDAARNNPIISAVVSTVIAAGILALF